MPFASAYYTRFLNYVRDKLIGGIEIFKRSATKLHIFIDIQGPTFLLPQKKDGPSLLVFDTGTRKSCLKIMQLQVKRKECFFIEFISRRIVG